MLLMENCHLVLPKDGSRNFLLEVQRFRGTFQAQNRRNKAFNPNRSGRGVNIPPPRPYSFSNITQVILIGETFFKYHKKLLDYAKTDVNFKNIILKFRWEGKKFTYRKKIKKFLRNFYNRFSTFCRGKLG